MPLGIPHLVPIEQVPIGVWRPDVPEGTRVPVILEAHATMLSGSVVDLGVDPMGPARLVDTFVPHGYAVAVVSARGTGQSGGCMDYMGP